MKLVFRPMRPDDRTFVITSWLSSYRRSTHAGMISMARWWDVMKVEIEAVLARPHVRVLVAADPASTDHVADLFGHLVWDAEPSQPPLVFYVYVKHAYRTRVENGALQRGFGIGAGLFKAAGIDPRSPFQFVCNTRVVASLRDAGKIQRAEWRPLLGRVDGRGDDHDPRQQPAADR